jgi:hypothetical protein
MIGARGWGIVLALLLAGPARAAEVPVSAFAANVGRAGASTDAGGAVTLYVVPPARTFLLTDVLVANHGGEAGPLYLSDSQHVRCSVHLLQTTTINGMAPGFATLANTHETFTSGIPFGPGEPVLVTLANGTKGVDVTITGKLVPGPRTSSGVVRLPGGARDDGGDGAPAGDAGKP